MGGKKAVTERVLCSVTAPVYSFMAVRSVSAASCLLLSSVS